MGHRTWDTQDIWDQRTWDTRHTGHGTQKHVGPKDMGHKAHRTWDITRHMGPKDMGHNETYGTKGHGTQWPQGILSTCLLF